MVYTARTRSLAALEVLVHMDIRHAPPDFVIIPATVPSSLVQKLESEPTGWDSLPARDVQRQIGTDWLRSRSSVGLEVPSVVVRGETNVLLNPIHPKFRRIVIHEPEPFAFDPRLLRDR